MSLKKKDQDAISEIIFEMYGGQAQPQPQAQTQVQAPTPPQPQELSRRLTTAQENLAWEKQMGMMTEEEYQTEYQNLVTRYNNAIKQSSGV